MTRGATRLAFCAALAALPAHAAEPRSAIPWLSQSIELGDTPPPPSRAKAGRGGSRTEYELGDRSALFLRLALGAFVVRMLALLLAFSGGVEAARPGRPSRRPARLAGRPGKLSRRPGKPAGGEARS